MSDLNTRQKETITPGALYIVSTPIGNLADITYRAVYILNEVDLIAAEDTRHTRILLDHYGISTAFKPYHEHNAYKMIPVLLDRLESGEAIALVSDAGTPTLSDPGYRLVHTAINKGIKIIPVPGASALLAALAASGLPTDRVCYEGFLPRKKGRKTRLEQLADEPRTFVIFESPHRIVKTLSNLSDAIGGERRAVVCREMTKKFEEFARGTLDELIDKFTVNNPKGEITLVVEGTGKRSRTRDKRNKYNV
ncbi:MAG: 16S rRNA (cytidine(1402)-2'-O)-methyltransferase [Candidatus Electryonea clarkiae]|nr:16S rRNA (cytidine(1402)-2'-O)-methyltransferase [Candidatus Electryonea clarkiae]MDP8285530.1 16S rRNA (cytidine(1402)-2'-O)-methyltransferase [Candidatus Electryonea clarkiae]